MKKTVFALALLAASAGAWAQSSDQPDEGHWLIRVHALHSNSANDDGTGQNLTINNKWFPEVDISYFFTPNLALELPLTVPQKFNVYGNGKPLGTLKALPPTLFAQYHFTDLGQFKPYVGVGVNYTRFGSVNLAYGTGDVKRNSIGPALQVGLDFAVTKNIYLNVDVIKAWIKTRVYLSGHDMGTFKLDPLLVGVGIGYRF